MRIKICGLFREEDIDYVNEGQPDYAGFVFAESKRKVTPVLAQHLRFRLSNSIIPVGVFVDSPIADIAALYHNGVISAAQLHGREDESYINKLKELCGGTSSTNRLKIIKVINSEKLKKGFSPFINTDFYLIDSGAGSGKTFNWKTINPKKIERLWFLAGGINQKNIEEAMALKPFAIDISSGAETDGFKDRKKILQLIQTVKEGNSK